MSMKIPVVYRPERKMIYGDTLHEALLKAPPRSMVMSKSRSRNGVGSSIELVKDEKKRKLREAGTSGIWFANLIDGRRLIDEIAIKPVNNTFEGATEFNNCRLVNDIHPNLTFTPLGFLKVNDKKGFITRFDENVVSFNNTLWGEERPSESDVELMLHLGVAGLARLHSHGITHGDYYIANTARHIKTLEPRIIDTSTIYTTSWPDEFTRDLEAYADSIDTDNPRPGEDAPRVSKEQLKESFFYEYISLIPDIFPESRRIPMRKLVDTIMKDQYDI